MLERLAIAAEEGQARRDTAGEDRKAASHKVYSSSMWLEFEGAHHASIPTLGLILLSAARPRREEDTGLVR